MSGLTPERVRELADVPPLAPRETLWWGHSRIGSVEGAVIAPLGLAMLRRERDGWRLHGDVTAGLAQVAHALRAAGLVRAWRDEQLAVMDEDGARLGTVERGAARLLGIATHAVHLLGVTPDGRHWVQQRAFDKASDPGLWDTLVGGMVAASETVESALERETQEEAGLRMEQLRDAAAGGHVVTRRPSGEQPHGYVVERIDWYQCIVPAEVHPSNQDGEVAAFDLLAPAELAQRVERGDFTLDAALLFAAAGHLRG